MRGADDGGVSLPPGAGNPLLQGAVRAGRDGVAVTEGGEEGAGEGSQADPGGHVVVMGRVVGTRGHQEREGAGARLVGLLGERGVVGGLHVERRGRSGNPN